jgi:hypothetical protein
MYVIGKMTTARPTGEDVLTNRNKPIDRFQSTISWFALVVVVDYHRRSKSLGCESLSSKHRQMWVRPTSFAILAHLRV